MRKRTLRFLLGAGYVCLLTTLLLYQAGIFGGRRNWAVAVFGTLALGVALAVVLALYIRVSDRIAEAEENPGVGGAVQKTGTGIDGVVSTGEDKKYDICVGGSAANGNGKVSAGGDSRAAAQSYEEIYAAFLGAMDGYEISERELEVAWLLYRGYTNRQIGESLYIAETTVKKHVTHIYQKMDVCSRKEFRGKVQTGGISTSTPVG